MKNGQNQLGSDKDYGEIVTGVIFRKERKVVGRNQHKFTNDKLPGQPSFPLQQDWFCVETKQCM